MSAARWFHSIFVLIALHENFAPVVSFVPTPFLVGNTKVTLLETLSLTKTTMTTTTTTTATTPTSTWLSSSASSSSTNNDEVLPKLASAQTIIDYAYDSGVVLSITTLGPGYRAVARARHNETQIIGYLGGFLRPGGRILHMDKMEVFKKAVANVREEQPEYSGGGSAFGVGLLLGCLALRHGFDNGCTIAEFLAIDDEEKQHKRLVRHYQRLGLKVIRYVGEDIINIPDRLIWGGVGTLMNAEISSLLVKWTPVFVKDGENENE